MKKMKEYLNRKLVVDDSFSIFKNIYYLLDNNILKDSLELNVDNFLVSIVIMKYFGFNYSSYFSESKIRALLKKGAGGNEGRYVKWYLGLLNDSENKVVADIYDLLIIAGNSLNKLDEPSKPLTCAASIVYQKINNGLNFDKNKMCDFIFVEGVEAMVLLTLTRNLKKKDFERYFELYTKEFLLFEEDNNFKSVIGDVNSEFLSIVFLVLISENKVKCEFESIYLYYALMACLRF